MKQVVLVEDNGPIHLSKLTRNALEARKHRLTVEWLPKYPPELNDVEIVWHDLTIWLTRPSSTTKRSTAPSTQPSMP
jgi:transposase